MLLKAISRKGTNMSEELNSLFDDEQEQVVDAPEAEDGAGEAEPEEEEEEEILDSEDSDGDGEPAPQPPEVNHQFAEFRKRSEAEIGRARAEAERASQMASMLFETAYKGEVNPFTGRPIETIEDFVAWKQENERQSLQQAGLPPDYIEQLINNHPVIKQAGAIIQQNQKMQGRMAFDRELSEIQKLNPKIRSIDDLVAETKDDETFQALQKGGMPLSKAYATTHRISQRKADSSKDHLQSVGGGSAGDASEPSKDVMQEYLNMGFTKDEAVKHWRKEHKNG